jgi:hypothetical protein
LREVKQAPELHDRLARVVYNLGGGRVPFVYTNTVIASPAAAAETVIATTPAINPPSDTPTILLFGVYQILCGTNGVAIQTRMRQGTTTGGLLLSNTPSLTAVAASNYIMTILAQDTTALLAGIQYSMCAVVTSASAASTVANAALLALALG